MIQLAIGLIIRAINKSIGKCFESTRNNCC